MYKSNIGSIVEKKRTELRGIRGPGENVSNEVPQSNDIFRRLDPTNGALG